MPTNLPQHLLYTESLEIKDFCKLYQLVEAEAGDNESVKTLLAELIKNPKSNTVTSFDTYSLPENWLARWRKYGLIAVFLAFPLGSSFLVPSVIFMNPMDPSYLTLLGLLVSVYMIAFSLTAGIVMGLQKMRLVFPDMGKNDEKYIEDVSQLLEKASGLSSNAMCYFNQGTELTNFVSNDELSTYSDSVFSQNLPKADQQNSDTALNNSNHKQI
jgi:hypothetical protein